MENKHRPSLSISRKIGNVELKRGLVSVASDCEILCELKQRAADISSEKERKWMNKNMKKEREKKLGLNHESNETIKTIKINENKEWIFDHFQCQF